MDPTLFNGKNCLKFYNLLQKEFQMKKEIVVRIDGENFYFVHSYYAEICENTVATCDYIVPFGAAMHKDNFYATQFHPEKSGSIGEKILLNFLKL